MKLSTALEGFWLDKRLPLSSNTQVWYRLILNRLRAFLDDPEVEQVISDDIRRFLLSLTPTYGYGKRSVHDAWAALSSFWRWAEQELDIAHILRGRVPAPPYPKHTIDPFTADEVRLLVQAAKQTKSWTARGGKTTRSRRPTALRDVALILTLLDSGVRVSELCALQVGDYEPARGRLHIRHGKGDRARFVIVGSRAAKALWRYLATRSGAAAAAPLFATRENTALERNNVRHLLVRLGEQAGVANVHPHRFRHTFAITFLRNGGSPLFLQALLGHARLETVQHYVRRAAQDIEAARAFSPADGWRL
jgi:integrase/recombinase XerD